MPWGVAAQGAGETEWTRNGLVFETEEEADEYAKDLYARWTGCDATMALTVDEPVNYTFDFETRTIKAVPKEVEVQCDSS